MYGTKGVAMSGARVYAEAYELKRTHSKVTGFRAVAGEFVNDKLVDGSRRSGELRPDFATAKLDAKKLAIELLAGRRCRTGSYRNPKDHWRCNYWLA